MAKGIEHGYHRIYRIGYHRDRDRHDIRQAFGDKDVPVAPRPAP
jgi:hypothetical protein